MDLIYQEGVRQGISQVDVEVMNTRGHRKPASSTNPGETGWTGTASTTSLEPYMTVAHTTKPSRTKPSSTSSGAVPKEVHRLKQQKDPYERIFRTYLPNAEKKRSAKKDFRAIPDSVEIPVAAYPITYWVVGGWTASELADTDHCQ
uniref:Uncharacterized protein n=1 Tax=Chromera velia CCMP2878 TaxID=1169474 RepID=A0A0G4GSL3_9ALVE|eukprot:Cvel_23177.t1-p1 / transcript=Cvel_23177.t1 / gene=Cvel_23177 / organism=Chromera_velia_CCMP2878 / gene_product=hypothetical protein / transcript_product=hypothetical protein / location=Cvel_scaffold2360:6813-7303(+) / protein_length=145 / sequence_SO=supercontig / SO=protein_coding / is_pseudo=false